MNKALKILPRKEQKVIKTKLSIRTPEVGSGLVRIAHKISTAKNERQIVKIGDRYFKVKELG